MSAQYQIERDLKEAESMADALEEYVRGNQLYGNASGGIFANMPSLTIGALATRLRRLDVLRPHLSAKQQETLNHAMRQHTSVQQEWRYHYEEKIKHEAHSRLDAMRTFFRECADSTRLCASVYPPEVLRRTVVQEVLRLMNELNISMQDKDAENNNGDDLETKLRGTDSKLRGLVKPHPFLWDDILQPAYPKDEFWWLYNKPPSPDDAKKA